MSNLSAFPYIPERAEATPALWNNIFSVLSANDAALNSAATISFPSGNTLSVFSSIDASGNLHAGNRIGIGVVPSADTVEVLTIGADSSKSDYILFHDPTGAKSSYILGSRVGGTADGLNIYDASGSTMIASFSKQSIRFFQQVVGPVFDLGGALTGTYNAATFGTAANSKESRIQAAINQASIDGIARVYVPKSMYPYSASSISFIYPVQMIREGGNDASYDVQAYGADPTGGLEATSAMQAAHNTGQLIYYPTGIYKFSRITGLVSGGIVGDGAGKSFLSSTDTGSGQLITYIGSTNPATSSNVPLFRDVTIQASTLNKTGGAGLQIISTVGESLYFLVQNIIFNNLPIGLDITTAEQWRVIGCSFLNYNIAGLQVANTWNSDSGDGRVLGNVFSTPQSTGTAIVQQSSGGLAVIGNKLLGGSGGYAMQWRGTDSGDLLIVGNSIEKVLGGNPAISLTRASGTSSFRDVQIVGNQFGSEYNAISTDNSGFLSNVVITGNVFDLSGSGTPSGVSMNNVTGFVITDNFFRAAGTGSGVSVASCTSGRIALNTYYAIGTHVAITSSTDVEQWDPTTSLGTGIALSKGTLYAPTLWVASGISALSSIVSSSYVSSSRTIMGGDIWGSSVSIINNDQSTARITINNTGAAGRNYAIISGVLNDGNGAFSIADLTGNASVFQIAATSNVAFFLGVLTANAGVAVQPTYAFSSESSLGWYRSGVSRMGLSYGQLTVPDGSNTTPSIGLSSATSVGFYSSGVQTIAQSLGTLNLATNSVRLSMRTLAGSAVTASAANTNIATNEVVFTVTLASGASLLISSGGTTWGFNSTFSVKNT